MGIKSEHRAMNAATTLANLRVRVIAGDPFVRDALGAALAGLAGIDTWKPKASLRRAGSMRM